MVCRPDGAAAAGDHHAVNVVEQGIGANAVGETEGRARRVAASHVRSLASPTDNASDLIVCEVRKIQTAERVEREPGRVAEHGDAAHAIHSPPRRGASAACQRRHHLRRHDDCAHQEVALVSNEQQRVVSGGYRPLWRRKFCIAGDPISITRNASCQRRHVACRQRDGAHRVRRLIAGVDDGVGVVNGHAHRPAKKRRSANTIN